MLCHHVVTCLCVVRLTVYLSIMPVSFPLSVNWKVTAVVVLTDCLLFCLCGSHTSSVILLHCYIISLYRLAMYPMKWLTAHIVPVFKKGIASQVSNYRPISLTCVLSKILERIVVGRIVDHLHYSNILHLAQHGFLKSRSTCTNLLESLNDWSIIVQSRQQVAIVYIDFSKAFDVMSHPKLFARLCSYGIRDVKIKRGRLRSPRWRDRRETSGRPTSAIIVGWRTAEWISHCVGYSSVGGFGQTKRWADVTGKY